MKSRLPVVGITRPVTLRRRVLHVLLYLKKSVRDYRLGRYQRTLVGPLFSPKALVVSNDGIGNAVEATPLVQAIKMLWPRAEVTFLAPPGDLFADWALVDRVVTDVPALTGEAFDHVFMSMAHKVPPEGLPFRSGRVHRVRQRFYAWQTQPERESVMGMIRRLGFRGATPPLYVSLAPPETPLPAAELRICFAPGGKPDFIWRHKRWPHYNQLARRLLDHYPGSQIVILGGPRDDLPAGFPDDATVVDLRGRLSLRQSAWVMKHADLVVGNDCGPMHMADAVQTPGVVLFGMSCPLKNGPQYRMRPLWNEVECSPCEYTPDLREACADPRCLAALSVDHVFAAIAKLVAEV